MTTLATFEDLTAQVYEFEIDDPAGEPLVVQMRALTPGERLRVEFAQDDRPRAKLMRFEKVGDTAYPLYDEQDHGYRQRLAEWVARQNARVIIASLVSPVIPGETDAERLENFATLAQWARDGLLVASNLLLTSSRERVRRHSFRPVATADDDRVPAQRLDAGAVSEPAARGNGPVAGVGN